MDPKLLLVNCISLLFRETQLDKNSNPSFDLVAEAMQTIKISEAAVEGDQYRETMASLKGTVDYLALNHSVTGLEKDQLLQRIRVNCGQDIALYAVFEKAFNANYDPETLKKIVLRYRDDLRTYLRESRIKEVLKRYYTKTHFSNEKVDFNVLVDEISQDLEPLRCGLADLRKPWVVDEIDFNDLQNLEDCVERSLIENGNEGMLRCGWQAANNMLGAEVEDTYYRRCDFVVCGGLQHNFKSGWLLSHFKHFALYNKPYMIDPTKKPLLYLISAENSVKDNLIWLYISLKENETGEKCNVKGIPPKEIARYVNERLTATGYHIKMIRIDPSDFTYRDLFDRILELEAEGFEIHALLFDYLNMISKRGCSQGPMGSDIRDLFRRVRNFTSPRGILFMTPHQLSTEAKGLLRSGVAPEDFVKEIANKGYWDSCKTIDQEVDLEIYFHKVVRDGVSYLTVQRGKHRKPTITPEQYMYFVLQFYPVGGLRDDVLGENTALRRVGGKRVTEGEDQAWYEAA